MAIDPGLGAVVVAADLESHEQLLLCRRDMQSAESDMRRMLTELKRTLAGAPRGGVYFTCVARGPNLFGSNAEEMGLIEEHLGSFPLAGFFGNGEISHDRLYAYTGVLTVFA